MPVLHQHSLPRLIQANRALNILSRSIGFETGAKKAGVSIEADFANTCRRHYRYGNSSPQRSPQLNGLRLRLAELWLALLLCTPMLSPTWYTSRLKDSLDFQYWRFRKSPGIANFQISCFIVSIGYEIGIREFWLFRDCQYPIENIFTLELIGKFRVNNMGIIVLPQGIG